MPPLVAIYYTEFTKLDLEEPVLASIDAEIAQFTDPNTPEAQDTLERADALMVTTPRVTGEMLRRMKRCKLVSRVGTGLDSIDIAAATECGIWVTNVPDYSIDEVSTHAIALLMAHARGLPRLFEQAERHEWNQTSVRPIPRLKGQTLGIVGFGRIARATASKALALELNVLANDPYVDAAVIEAAGCKPVALDTLLMESDYISLHSPLTPETRHMIDAQALALMKPTAFLINAARGPLIDADALLAAVREKKIAGAALDVFETEPLPPDHPLFHEPNIWVTPHVAWYSEAAKVDMRVRGAEQVVRVLRGEMPTSAVNWVK
jgi:D-3-phosphoglycerate dehydrogenase